MLSLKDKAKDRFKTVTQRKRESCRFYAKTHKGIEITVDIEIKLIQRQLANTMNTIQSRSVQN